MGIRFRHGKLTVVNYGSRLTDTEVDTIKKNYDGVEVSEILYRCKSIESHKPWYLQAVDWIKLIPEMLMREGNYVLKLSDKMPREVAAYMIVECYSRSNRLPKIIEERDGTFFRIVDLEYEAAFSRNKRNEQKQNSTEE